MENGYVESFNGKFREECLDQNWFRGLAEASQIIEAWREDYNHERPHSALGYMSPMEFLRTAESCSHVHEQVANMQTAEGSAIHKFTSALRTNEQPRPRRRKLNKMKNLEKV